jgi:maltose O-acetyltransferase
MMLKRLHPFRLPHLNEATRLAWVLSGARQKTSTLRVTTAWQPQPPGLREDDMGEHVTEKDKMLSGDLYFANDSQLVNDRKRAKALCNRYNQHVVDLDTLTLQELIGYRTDAYLEPPFFCDYGYNIRLGKNVYANHNLVVLDGARVSIGDNVFIGPNVVISTAGHPVDPVIRTSGLEFAKPISIGDNVWIGASVVILPGVDIGLNVTIGAGSVVTKSIPTNCVAVGNPCRILRHLCV